MIDVTTLKVNPLSAHWRVHGRDYAWVTAKDSSNLVDQESLPPEIGFGTAGRSKYESATLRTTELEGALSGRQSPLFVSRSTHSRG